MMFDAGIQRVLCNNAEYGGAIMSHLLSCIPAAKHAAAYVHQRTESLKHSFRKKDKKSLSNAEEMHAHRCPTRLSDNLCWGSLCDRAANSSTSAQLEP